MFSWRNVQEDPINTYRPFYEKFQNGHIFGKSPYYRPWFFDVLRGFQKSQILTERPYYRPCFLGEMFKWTQLTCDSLYMHVTPCTCMCHPCRLASTLSLCLSELHNKRKCKVMKRPVLDRRTPSPMDQGTWEQGGRDNYLSWCTIKSALKTSTARQTLLSYACAANNADLNKTLPEKALLDLPDFVLLDLSPQCLTLDLLVSKPVIMPVESLLLSRQYRPKITLTWFKIINYYHRLIQRCFWQKVSLQLPHSDWMLHYNTATPLLYGKAKALFGFLSTHCGPFRSCQIPVFPQQVVPSGGLAPWTTLTGGTHREPHLQASDIEVTIIWHTNPLPSSSLPSAEQAESSTSADNKITGYFALNLKTVGFPIHQEPHLLGIDTHMFHTSLHKLACVHDTWKELSKAVSAFLDSRANMRPVSRSPSKQRKVDRSIHPPDDLVKRITKAVKSVAVLFESKAKEVQSLPPPHPSPPHTLPSSPSPHTLPSSPSPHTLPSSPSPHTLPSSPSPHILPSSPLSSHPPDPLPTPPDLPPPSTPLTTPPSSQLPRLELHAVPNLTKLSEPFLHTTLKGDAYYFLKEILTPKQ